MTYEFECSECGEKKEVECTITEHVNLSVACICGVMMTQKITAPMISFGNWRPDPRVMDGEKEARAAGFYD